MRRRPEVGETWEVTAELYSGIPLKTTTGLRASVCLERGDLVIVSELDGSENQDWVEFYTIGGLHCHDPVKIFLDYTRVVG